VNSHVPYCLNIRMGRGHWRLSCSNSFYSEDQSGRIAKSVTLFSFRANSNAINILTLPGTRCPESTSTQPQLSPSPPPPLLHLEKSSRPRGTPDHLSVSVSSTLNYPDRPCRSSDRKFKHATQK